MPLLLDIAKGKAVLITKAITAPLARQAAKSFLLTNQLPDLSKHYPVSMKAMRT